MTEAQLALAVAVPGRGVEVADAGRVSSLKRKDKITVVNLVPAQVVLKSALEDAEDLAVHIVFGGSKQQQSTDDPAKIASSGGTSSLLLPECVGHMLGRSSYDTGSGGLIHDRMIENASFYFFCLAPRPDGPFVNPA